MGVIAIIRNRRPISAYTNYLFCPYQLDCMYLLLVSGIFQGCAPAKLPFALQLLECLLPVSTVTQVNGVFEGGILSQETFVPVSGLVVQMIRLQA
jgi:hypothetical protein